MGFRCELCDQWLSLFQISKLCDTCYKTRTIVKAYSAEGILKSLQENFLIENVPTIEEKKDPEPEKTADDQKDYEKPKTRHNKFGKHDNEKKV